VTSTSKDPPELVLARCSYLLSHPDLLPTYDSLSCNSECVAVFCSTGLFLTLQASSFLEYAAASQAKGALITGGMVAGMTTTVVVPQAGVLGWIGLTTTTTVPLVATQPWIVPVLALYGLVALVPLEKLRRCKKKWKEWEEALNNSFWGKCEQDILDSFWVMKNEGKFNGLLEKVLEENPKKLELASEHNKTS